LFDNIYTTKITKMYIHGFMFMERLLGEKSAIYISIEFKKNYE